MNYNFDTPVDRRNTNSLKWEVPDQELPMWVADMDFRTAPEIQEALKKRVEHGIYGYSVIPDSWYQAIIRWWKERHSFEIQKEWLTFCTGVVPAIASIVRKMTTVGEQVLLLTPVYSVFYHVVNHNGRKVVECPLQYQGDYLGEYQRKAQELYQRRDQGGSQEECLGEYQIDWADLEQKLADPQTTMMILCNPHNPIGKIWDRATLKRIGELCQKRQVLVISDEIHCDLTDPGCSYIPFASVSDVCRENSITCLSPSKTFNLAGLQTAAVMIPNPHISHKVAQAFNDDEIAEPNAFAVDAVIAAYTEGGLWLDELRTYLYENKQFVIRYLHQHIKEIQVVHSEATYLLWLDCHKVIGSASEMVDYIQEHTGLYLSAGYPFGGDGESFLRMNLACPRKQLEDGMQRLAAGVLAYEEWVARQ